MINPTAEPPQPHSTPSPLSPPSQLRSFGHSDLPVPPPGSGGSDERDREYPSGGTSEYDELHNQNIQPFAQREELRSRLDDQAHFIERLENNESHRRQLIRGVVDWFKSGESLLRTLADTLDEGRASSLLRRGHSYMLKMSAEREHERERDRVPLSGVMVGRQYAERLERDKTLSVIMPSSPYTVAPYS
jgi:hypothetical protein